MNTHDLDLRRRCPFISESREDTRGATNYADFFGAGRLRPSDVQRLTQEEAASTSDMFVVLSDVWLDKVRNGEREGGRK